jgi:hypothetical protein
LLGYSGPRASGPRPLAPCSARLIDLGLASPVPTCRAPTYLLSIYRLSFVRLRKILQKVQRKRRKLDSRRPGYFACLPTLQLCMYSSTVFACCWGCERNEPGICPSAQVRGLSHTAGISAWRRPDPTSTEGLSLKRRPDPVDSISNPLHFSAGFRRPFYQLSYAGF